MSSTGSGGAAEPATVGDGRRPYRRPTVDRLGDLRSLTLGSSPGIPDSGVGMPEQPQP